MRCNPSVFTSNPEDGRHSTTSHSACCSLPWSINRKNLHRQGMSPHPQQLCNHQAGLPTSTTNRLSHAWLSQEHRSRAS
jgi:hypothetical protein